MTTPLKKQDRYYLLQKFSPYQNFEQDNKAIKDITRFIIDDGGEIRQDKAYEEDEITLKKGWIRLYIK